MVKDKVILITGGGSGMGQLAARNFAKEGWKVAALDINKLGLTETAEGYDTIETWLVDITNPQAVSDAVKEVESQLGPIYSLYNCAAIMPFGKLLDQDIAIIHKQMEINYGGLVNVAKAALPAMVARGEGEFVSFASMAGLIPTLLTGAYSATKAAVVMFTEILYHENRDSGVKFACVCPPIVNTPLLQQGRDSAWPKMLENQKTLLQPQDVLDKIRVSLDKGEFLVFPGKGTRFGALMRRLMPAAIWKEVHKVEGW